MSSNEMMLSERGNSAINFFYVDLSDATVGVLLYSNVKIQEYVTHKHHVAIYTYI